MLCRAAIVTPWPKQCGPHVPHTCRALHPCTSLSMTPSLPWHGAKQASQREAPQMTVSHTVQCFFAFSALSTTSTEELATRASAVTPLPSRAHPARSALKLPTLSHGMPPCTIRLATCCRISTFASDDGCPAAARLSIAPARSSPATSQCGRFPRALQQAWINGWTTCSTFLDL